MEAMLNNQQLLTTDFIGLRNQLIVELFYGTGMRLSELITLKISQINHQERTLKVAGKRNKERVIPFTVSLEQIMQNYLRARQLEQHIQHDYLIVTDNGQKAYPMFIQRIVKNKLKEFSSVEKTSPHVLRHSYATHLLNKGAEINAVKDLLGHSSLAATQVYTHNSMDKLKKVFDQAHPKA
jgi:integrase/recombinase XerC